MRILVLERGPKYIDRLSEGLDELGIEVIGRDRVSDMNKGDLVLVARSARSVSSGDVEILRRSAEHGMRRVLWQTEPLPPTDLSNLTHHLLRSYVAKGGTIDHKSKSLAISSLIKRFERRVISYAIAADMRVKRFSEASHLPSPTMLRFPMREARSLKELWDLRLLDNVLVSLPSRQHFLAKLDIPSVVLPAAYSRSYGRRLENVERDIDVVFLGKVSARRRALIDDIGERLSRRGWSLMVVDHGCYGEERTLLLNRTKIILNLHNFTWDFPLMRLFMAMSCGALVVSEKALSPPAFFDQRHLVLADTGQLVDVLTAYLEDGGRRASLVEAAYMRATQELTFSNFAKQVFSDISKTPMRYPR